jgi:hypothetical protein
MVAGPEGLFGILDRRFWIVGNPKTIPDWGLLLWFESRVFLGKGHLRRRIGSEVGAEAGVSTERL